jgi:MFS family permease
MAKGRLSFKAWLSIILIGFAGQLAWSIENNYINMWVYSQTGDASYITYMTIASAVAATLTTFFMGVLSDRLGKRKPFIAIGYTVWGLSVVLFGACNYKSMASMYGEANAIVAVGVSMVIADCLMTFFGSTANDACYNAWLTDQTDESNRGKVNSVVSSLPLFATVAVLLVAGLFGATSDTKFQEDPMPWVYFFIVFGAIVTAIGVASFFLLPKDEIAPNRDRSYWANLIYGFRPSVVKKNVNLYVALLSFMTFNMAMDAFMPYYMVYFSQMEFETTTFYLMMGAIIVVAIIAVIIVGLFMDRIGKMKILLPALGIGIIGFLCMFFSTEIWSIIVSGILMMSGYLIGTAVLSAEVMDEIPEKEVGLFQGVRMIFAVMLPMIIGSLVSEAAMRATGGTYVNDYGEEAVKPNRYMFLVTLGFMILALAPSIWLIVRKRRESKDKATAEAIKAQADEGTSEGADNGRPRT